MSWKELAEWIAEMSDDDQDGSATVYDAARDEYFPVAGKGECNDGVLDDGHPFITI